MLSDFISLFFPRYCVACQGTLTKNEELICVTCLYEIPKTNSHTETPNFIESKFYGKIRLLRGLAYFQFERKGRVQRLLHQLKYGNKPEIGQLVGNKYGVELAAYNFQNQFDCIVPVPLHKAKLRRRGYNQSAMFGEGLAETLEIPQHTDLLIRTKQTATQTRKSRLERWQNVEHIFKVSNSSSVKDRNILLVDDVITTGSTMEACAHALLEAGAKSVSVGAIAAAK